ncbi:hypothetical protein IT408_04765 [Candidatus Uhrbacteria bacterium]|nr:hypothetical protein [Candidatus Uhrbacteria bacterium]
MWENFLERWRMLTREQQISVVVLMICGGCAITLSLFRIQASIKEPFLVRKDTLLTAKKILGPSDQQKLEKEQRTDTDGDGLSDWDEVNVYKTNPNLRDSCGDGMPDNIRIASGLDVTCTGVPVGQPIDTSNLKQENTLSPTVGLPNEGIQNGLQNNAIENSKTFQANQVPKNLVQQMLPRDPKVIRQMLAGNVDAAKLQAMSDDELLKLYDSAMSGVAPEIPVPVPDADKNIENVTTTTSEQSL